MSSSIQNTRNIIHAEYGLNNHEYFNLNLTRYYQSLCKKKNAEYSYVDPYNALMELPQEKMSIIRNNTINFTHKQADYTFKLMIIKSCEIQDAQQPLIPYMISLVFYSFFKPNQYFRDKFSSLNIAQDDYNSQLDDVEKALNNVKPNLEAIIDITKREHCLYFINLCFKFATSDITEEEKQYLYNNIFRYYLIVSWYGDLLPENIMRVMDSIYSENKHLKEISNELCKIYKEYAAEQADQVKLGKNSRTDFQHFKKKLDDYVLEIIMSKRLSEYQLDLIKNGDVEKFILNVDLYQKCELELSSIVWIRKRDECFLNNIRLCAFFTIFCVFQTLVLDIVCPTKIPYRLNDRCYHISFYTRSVFLLSIFYRVVTFATYDYKKVVKTYYNKTGHLTDLYKVLILDDFEKVKPK